MDIKNNELECANSFIKILKQINNETYEILIKPDDINRETEDIDFIFEASHNKKIAVEHTIIELFDNQINYVEEHFRIVKEIESMCKNELIPNYYYIVSILPSLIVNKKKREKEQLIKKISKIIISNLNRHIINKEKFYPIDNSGFYLNCKYCNEISKEKLNSKIIPIPSSPEECNDFEICRFKRALRKKLPKLIKYKSPEFETALLLEDVYCKNNNLLLTDMDEKDKKQLKLVDYIVCFSSIDNEVIIGNIWKMHDKIFKFIPYHLRFEF